MTLASPKTTVQKSSCPSLPTTIPMPNMAEGRFASLLVRDRELADNLSEGFQELSRKAMRSLREIEVDPRGHKA